MNVRLIQAGYGALSQSDITNSHQYHHVVLLIDNVRRSLCDTGNNAFRQPFLEVLIGLYDNVNTSAKIKRIRPIRPTKQDIFDFFANHWPEVHLVPFRNAGTSYEWGYTNAGAHAANNDVVHVSFPLVDFWTRSATNGQPKLSADKMSMIFVAVLLHEVAHRIVVWWLQGSCNTPQEAPFLGEAGEFIERMFFGGVLEGWWKQGHVGDFNYLENIAISTDKGDLYVLDDNAVSQIFNSFKSMTCQLPLLKISSMSCTPLSTHLVRAKISPPRTQIVTEPQETSLSPVSPSHVVGLGLERRPFLHDDKVFI